MLQSSPDLKPAEIQDILHKSAEDRGTKGPDNSYGWGVVDAVSALNRIFGIQNIIVSKQAVNEDEVVTFHASAMGKIELYEWDFDGDGDYDWKSKSTSKATHSYTEAGTYTAELRISDIDGFTDSSSVVITVNNVPPEAKAAASCEFVEEDEIVTLVGNESWDTASDYTNLEYLWDFGDGSSSGWQSTPSLDHSYADKGTYEVTLTVRDDDGQTDEDSVRINVMNVIPIADAGSEKTVCEDETVIFYGNRSYDSPSDRTKLNYTWKFGDGSTGFGITAAHSYADRGFYMVTLTVRDDDGKIGKSSMIVEVENVIPSLAAETDKIIGDEDEKILFLGEGWDTPSDSNDLKYRWDFGDGSISEWTNTPGASHTYSNAGNYSVRFEVRDDNNDLNSTTVTVKINNVPPGCKSSSNGTIFYEDDPVNFACIKSWDTSSDMNSLKYYWDFGDGTTAEGKYINHSFKQEGNYKVHLIVIDDDGDKGISELEIIVCNTAPIAKIDYYSPQNPTTKNVPIAFNGSGSWDTASDLSLLQFYWDFGDGSTGHGQIVEHTYKNSGQYKVTLVVTDDDGAIGIISSTISVDEEQIERESTTTQKSSFWMYVISISSLIIIMVILFIFLLLFRKKVKNR